MSGIIRQDLSPGELTEPDRVLVESTDLVENVQQLKALREVGYSGYISMEPFNVGVQHSADLQAQLQRSFANVTAGLSAPE